MISNGPEDWLAEAAARTPERPALLGGGAPLNFARLDRAVGDIAQSLIAAGLEPGRPAGAALSSAQTLLVTILAAFRAGIPIFPVDARLPADAIMARLGVAGIEAAISDQDLPLRLIPPPMPGRAPGVPPHAAPLTAVRLIVATSGSTAQPKGVMLTGANLTAAVMASNARIPLTPDDCWLCCMPLHSVGGLSIPLRCLKAGAACLLFERFDAPRVMRALAEGSVTHVSLVPAMLAALLDLDIPPAPNLRAVLIGGAALSPALAERAARAGWPLLPSYGMSETASQAATHTDGLAAWRPGLAGRPLPGLKIALSPSGRVRLKGAAVMAGYANPALRPGDGLDAEGWFESSDLGRIDSEGRLEILGRADEVLISGGVNIHPQEVEKLAAACPGIRALAVTGREDSVWGSRLVLVFSGSAEPGAVLDWCRDALPSSLRPREAVRVENLPELPSGKLDRAALRRLIARPAAS
ncbi:MAG: AMP-binding protein [Rhodospirillaceae bacterium]|nr:AMP-binding protein [Rhodospirillaceae bacterium]